MFAAELLGLPLVPPYSEASSVQQVLQGTNYASAAAGILDDSGGNFVSNHGSQVFITNK
jgi:1-deoxy-D-xylulose 5-phosphate reductoisomerase